MLRKIVSYSFMIASVLFLFLSIGVVTSVDVMEGEIPVQEAFIGNKTTIDSIANYNMRGLPHGLTNLFYISLILMLASSIVSFSKTSKVKSSITIIFSIGLNIYGFVAHNYIVFLMCFNVFLLLYILLGSFDKNSKVYICSGVVSFLLFLFNCIGLLNHFFLELDSIHYDVFVNKLVCISKVNLVSLILWMIPCFMLLIGVFVKKMKRGKIKDSEA